MSLAFALLFFAFASNYVANYFEVRNQETPEWVYFLFMLFFIPIIGVLYSKFIDVYSDKERKNKKT